MVDGLGDGAVVILHLDGRFADCDRVTVAREGLATGGNNSR